MAGKGPPPKPAHLRQRTNRKAGSATLDPAPVGDIPAIPNPDGREWHPLTVNDWAEWWASEMASQWLPTDVGGLGILAVLCDNFYKAPNDKAASEIRLQRQCFGLTPLDRSRLQWEIRRAEEPERKNTQPAAKRSSDPRSILRAVK